MSKQIILAFVILILGFAIVLLASIHLTYEQAYKQGQIDAIKGNIKYELLGVVESKTTEEVWVNKYE